jgi:hypothetical protein
MSEPPPFAVPPNLAALPEPAPPLHLLDRLRLACQARGLAPGDVTAGVDFVRRFILFHGKRHPRDLGPADVARFLRPLATGDHEPAARVQQAHAALRLLYDHFLPTDPASPPAPAEPPAPPPTPSPFLNRCHEVLRLRHDARRTEDCYVPWIKRFILFHGKRQPAEMGEAEIQTFLTHLAVHNDVSASTQNQAFHALLFLHQQVLGRPLERLDAVRARRPQRLPVVMSRPEVR